MKTKEQSIEMLKKLLEANDAEFGVMSLKPIAEMDARKFANWAHTMLEVKTRREVIRGLLKALEDPESKATPATLKQWCVNHVLNRSRFPEHSTSPLGNLQERIELAVYADIIEGGLRGSVFGD